VQVRQVKDSVAIERGRQIVEGEQALCQFEIQGAGRSTLENACSPQKSASCCGRSVNMMPHVAPPTAPRRRDLHRLAAGAPTSPSAGGVIRSLVHIVVRS
jgi:hypothetical protein